MNIISIFHRLLTNLTNGLFLHLLLLAVFAF